MPSPRNVEDLRERIRAGWRPNYVLFLAPDPAQEGVLGPECLSQWYASPMELDGERFVTAEHYMMWYKARVFGDDDSVRQIQANDDPAVAKALGRRVRNFKNDVWAQHRFELVVRASLVKFQQNPRLYDYLMSTGDGVLAEASPVDLIWGIGFDAKQPDARNALAWKGQNLLGFALMRARDELSRA